MFLVGIVVFVMPAQSVAKGKGKGKGERKFEPETKLHANMELRCTSWVRGTEVTDPPASRRKSL